MGSWKQEQSNQIQSGQLLMSRKILLLSTWDDQGSGTALYRISKFLLETGYEVRLVVRDKSQTDSFIVQIPLKQRNIYQKVFNKLFLRPKENLQTIPEYYFFNTDEDTELISSQDILETTQFTPDLIITGLISGFINTKTIAELAEKTKAKVYMLMPDMSPLTGGCHYSWDCKGYQKDCNNCPAILNTNKKDRAYNNLQIKLNNIRRANIKILPGSGWTKNQAKLSALFKDQDHFYNINSCIDTRLFNNKHRDFAKKIFDLPENSKIIFTGSTFTSEKRKGIEYFIKALKYLWKLLDDKKRDNIFILIAGNHTVKNELIEQIPFQKQLIDYIKDNRLLSLAYQASDIFVCSSIEDAGPLMVSEALACGTPVVGFEMGVISNMVINGYNGYKAELKNSEDLADGILKILSLSENDYQQYSQNAVNQVEKYSSQKTVINVISQILGD